MPVGVVDNVANYHSFYWRCTEATEGDCLGVTLANVEAGGGSYTLGGCTCEEVPILFAPAPPYWSCYQRPDGVCANVCSSSPDGVCDGTDPPAFGDTGNFYAADKGLCKAGYWDCTATDTVTYPDACVDSGATHEVDWTLNAGFLGDYFGDGTCTCDFIDGPTAKIDSTNASFPTFSDLISHVQGYDGWMRTLNLPGERSLNKPTILGGITFFTSYVPSTETCSFGGYSYLWALYFETGTAYSSSVFESGSEVVDGAITMCEKYSLGLGLSSSVGIHVGQQDSGKVKGFIQQSTGAVEDLLLDPAFNVRSGLRYWKEN